jgi:ribosomal protein S18 acetylase RimI-like enzyme
MDRINEHPTPTELSRGVDGNLAALFRAMATLPGSELDESGPVARHLAFPINPMFKGAWAARIADGEVDAAIDATIGWFRARGAPFFFWWTGPDTEPADLGERLEKRGLLSMEGQQAALAHGIKQSAAGAPVMGADLAAMNEAVLERVPAGFTISAVRSESDLADFKRVFVETYEIPEWAGQAWADATRTIGIGRTPWRMYLGRLDGEVVATNMLFCGGGYASIYAVATLPKAQGKGIGAAISLKPLLDARAEGYRYAVLFSTEMGFKVYERIGFRDTGVRINRYLWRAPT